MTQFHQEGQRVSGTQYNVGGDIGTKGHDRYYRVDYTRAGEEVTFGERIKYGYLEGKILFLAADIVLDVPLRAWPMLLRNRFILSGHSEETRLSDMVKKLEEQGFKREE